MDVFEHAMKMEIQGKKMYEDLLEKTKDEPIKTLLRMLINQEDQHFKTFEYMKNSNTIENLEKANFSGIKTIFEKMKDEEFPKDQLDFYDKILKVESDTEEYYRDIAQTQTDEKIKNAILQIASEEHSHYIIINNIIMMINAPNSWVESAEFNHLEDY